MHFAINHHLYYFLPLTPLTPPSNISLFVASDMLPAGLPFYYFIDN